MSTHTINATYTDELGFNINVLVDFDYLDGCITIEEIMVCVGSYSQTLELEPVRLTKEINKEYLVSFNECEEDYAQIFDQCLAHMGGDE